MTDPSPAPFEIGEIVAERYRIVRLLGEGGMAMVYEGEHLRLRQAVAVKVLRAELRDHPDVVARFEREGRAIGKLRSRHIVRVFDVDTTAKGVPFLVMELLDGGSLESEIAARGALPVGEAVSYAMQACAAVAEAHDRGVIHRDIKPANLLLANEGGERVLKVLDFGISKDPQEDARLTRTESIMGTPLYMAPEQFRSAKDIDGRADVWALGATLYELLAGRPPFTGGGASVAVSIVLDPVPALQTLRVGLPEGLVRAVERALAKKREDRFATVRDLSAALAPFAAALPAPEPQTVARASRSARPDAATELQMVTSAPQIAETTGSTEAVSVRGAGDARTTPLDRGGATKSRSGWIVAGAAALAGAAAVGWLTLRTASVEVAAPQGVVGPAATAPTPLVVTSLAPTSSVVDPPAPVAPPAPASSVAPQKSIGSASKRAVPKPSSAAASAQARPVASSPIFFPER